MPPTTRAKARQSELAKGSRLLKLPAELRNYIYELSFSTNQHDDEVSECERRLFETCVLHLHFSSSC